jgi:hypothetical protein
MISALGLSGYSAAALAFLCASAFIAGLARGFSGFGSALIFVPLASTVIRPAMAAALLLVVDIVMAASLIPHAARLAEKRDVLMMILGTLFGVPLGAFDLPAARAAHLGLALSRQARRGVDGRRRIGRRLPQRPRAGRRAAHHRLLAGRPRPLRNCAGEYRSLFRDLDAASEESFRRVCYALIAAAGLFSIPALDGVIR